MLPKKLQQKLDKRAEENAIRSLPKQSDLIDFSSNDYLGFAKDVTIFENTHQYLIDKEIIENGATGSRLLSGNHSLYQKVEQLLCNFHESEAALVFNSGYDANIGFFSSVPQRGDLILYDELIHASIRDGIKMSNAKSFKFRHNNFEDIQSHLERGSYIQKDVSASTQNEIYIVTESVFSMDGDTPDLKALAHISRKYNCRLVIDEAHAIGVHGSGLVQQLNLQKDVFARIATFGKALGGHGAAIIGSSDLKSYLINFARSLMYTTGLPPHSLATILTAYEHLKNNLLLSPVKGTKVQVPSNIQQLRNNIEYFKTQISSLGLTENFIPSNSAIHCAIVPGNESVKALAISLQKNGFNVKPILSPTVPKDQERLRFCLHSYNTKDQIKQVLALLKEAL